MTDQQKKLIFNLILGRIIEDEFLAKFPVDPRDPSFVTRALEDAERARDPQDVELALLVGFHFNNFGSSSVDILCRLLREDWHRKHEDIASLMQKLKTPRCVESLYEAALKDLPYLAYDDSRALSVKCIWALGSINAPEAREKLRLLAKSENTIVRENAIRLLKRAVEGSGG